MTGDRDPRSERTRCDHCGTGELAYITALPRSPGHPAAHDIFACESCGHMQWIEQGDSREA